MFEDAYLPFTERAPDDQYQRMLRTIKEQGILVPSQQDPNDRTKDAYTLPYAYTLYYPVENGAPVITERSIEKFWQKPINEKFAFANGVHTIEELTAYGCKGFWEPWATEAKCTKRGIPVGDLGPGSYGVAFHDFPMPDGSTFNQYEALIQQIKTNPGLRTHFVSPWIPFLNFRTDDLIQKAVVSPCHGWVKVKIFGNRMVLQMMMRANDVTVGGPSNMVQYFALLLALAKETGYTPMAYNHIILEPHIFVEQMDSVETMLTREPRCLPTMTLNEVGVGRSFFEHRGDSFALSNYNPHPAIPKIPVAI